MRNKLIELAMPFVYGGACEHQSGSCDLCDCRACNARNFADHLIANGVTLQQWIPVSERLPDPPCLIVDAKRNPVRIPQGVAEITDANGTWCMDAQLFDIVNGYDLRHYGNRITHWMPLPEPPKEEA